MTISELLALYPMQANTSVPDWILGHYKRYSISYANGLTDMHTQVSWLQSRNFTIDVRMPLNVDQVPVKGMADYTPDELQQLAQYDGWLAKTDWDGNMLSWRESEVSLQLHNRWTESAILKRVGNCMMEFCPSDAYVEDWRLQPSKPGPLIGLYLLEERELATAKLRHTGGGLIICGDYAALAIGRTPEANFVYGEKPLSSWVADAVGDIPRLTQLLDVETSVAKGDITKGFRVVLSTRPQRVGQTLIPLDGFEAPVRIQHVKLGEIQMIKQQLLIDGLACERLFTIETLEPSIAFPQTTGFTEVSADWYEQESSVLARYVRVVS